MTKLNIGDQILVRRVPIHAGSDPIWALANITDINSESIRVRLVVGKFFTATGDTLIPRILEGVEWKLN